MRSIIMVATRRKNVSIYGQFSAANIAAAFADNRLALQPKLRRSLLTCQPYLLVVS